MYSKHEASQLRQEFWTTLGKYLSPIMSADGVRVNWLNYKTGERNILFRMEADNKTAAVSIQLTHKDEGIRDLYFEQFLQLKAILHDTLNEEWNWVRHWRDDNGIQISKIYTEITRVSVFNKADWPTLISFFKPRIVALDEFWSMSKYTFEALR